ncbi:MAG: PIN domain-containing protein [Lapillicoccus sp.]
MTSAPATCDTSVLVAAVADWHPMHVLARASLRTRVTSIPAHTLLECYSVLTRLPAGHRVAASAAGELLDRLDFRLLECPHDVQRALVRQLAIAGIAGGSVYDGLVAATARHHRLALLSLDRRARTTYEVVGAGFEMLA